MIRRIVVCLALLLSCMGTSAVAASTSPNVVIFLTDDLGYGDLDDGARVPNLETLAASGVSFTHFYAAAPNCSPSRAGLLTGRWPTRSGIHNFLRGGRFNVPVGGGAVAVVRAAQVHLLEREYTLAEFLKTQGYATAHFGKWHLGAYPAEPSRTHPQPQDHGFDYTFGTQNNARPSHRNPENFVRNGEALGELDGFAAQLVVDDAIRILESTPPDQPFFHYVAFHEPHVPIASPERMIAHYPDVPAEEAEYLANIENVDDAIGRYIAALETLGHLDTTLIVFTSDNGPYERGQGSTGGLRGRKGSLFEGGIRVPAIWRGPGLAEGVVVSEPAQLTDLFPTVAAMLGASPPGETNFDGESILPLLQQRPFTREGPLFWFFYNASQRNMESPHAVLRRGKYLLAAFGDPDRRYTHWTSIVDEELIHSFEFERFELFDIVADPGQTQDVSDRHPDIADAMTRELLSQFESARADSPIWGMEGLPPPVYYAPD